MPASRTGSLTSDSLPGGAGPDAAPSANGTDAFYFKPMVRAACVRGLGQTSKRCVP